MNKILFIKNFTSIMNASLAKNILEKHDIIAIVKKRGIEFPGGYFGDKSGADLFIHEKYLKVVPEILNAYGVGAEG